MRRWLLPTAICLVQCLLLFALALSARTGHPATALVCGLALVALSCLQVGLVVRDVATGRPLT